MNAEARRRAVLAILAAVVKDRAEAHQFDAIGMPMEMLRALGMVKDPMDRLEWIRDPRNQQESLAEMEAANVEHRKTCAPDCDGQCGPLWFYGAIADVIVDAAQSDSERVAGYLAELGVPNATKEDDNHA